jgi:hypothetical protein
VRSAEAHPAEGRGRAGLAPQVARLRHHARCATAGEEKQRRPECQRGEQSRLEDGRGAPAVRAVPARGAASAGRGPVVSDEPAAVVTPYGPLALTVCGSVAGVTPYGPLGPTVCGSVAAVTPYGPLALTVRGSVAGVTPYGPRALGGSVVGDAPAAAGMARHKAQALMAIRRVSMMTSKGLENGAA